MKIKLHGSKLPRVEMTKLAQLKIELIVDMSQEEVGWLGLVSKTENLYTIEDVYILKQEVNGGTTEIDKGAWGELWEKLMNEGVLSNETQEIKGLYLWGHSHVNMAPSPSGQDDKQFLDHIRSKPPFMIRMITNKKNDYRIDLYCRDRDLEFGELDIWVEDDKPEQLRQEIKAQLDALVKPLVYTPTKVISTVGGQYKEDPFALGGILRRDIKDSHFNFRNRKSNKMVEALRRDAGDVMRTRRNKK